MKAWKKKNIYIYSIMEDKIQGLGIPTLCGLGLGFRFQGLGF